MRSRRRLGSAHTSLPVSFPCPPKEWISSARLFRYTRSDPSRSFLSGLFILLLRRRWCADWPGRWPQAFCAMFGASFIKLDSWLLQCLDFHLGKKNKRILENKNKEAKGFFFINIFGILWQKKCSLIAPRHHLLHSGTKTQVWPSQSQGSLCPAHPAVHPPFRAGR